jgi:hypothetical protein
MRARIRTHTSQIHEFGIPIQTKGKLIFEGLICRTDFSGTFLISKAAYKNKLGACHHESFVMRRAAERGWKVRANSPISVASATKKCLLRMACIQTTKLLGKRSACLEVQGIECNRIPCTAVIQQETPVRRGVPVSKVHIRLKCDFD